MSIKTVALVGAGGNLGPSILKQLLDSKKFTVSVISRESSTSTFPAGVTVHKANFESQSSLEAALKGQDAVVSTIGGAGLASQKLLVDAAVAVGVKRFIPSEFGSDTEDPKTLETLGQFFEAKVGLVNYLKSKEGTGTTWTAIVTGLFFDWCLQTGFISFDLKNHSVVLYEGGNVTWTTTVLSDIGRSVVGVLSNFEATKNKYVYVGTVTTTQNEVLAAFEKATGSKWTTTKIDTVESISEGKAKMAAGEIFPGLALVLRAVIFGGPQHGFHQDFEKQASETRKLFDFPVRTLDDIVASIVKGDAVV